MILITVGSTLFPFQRMATLVEHISHVRQNRERIIFQYGHTPPHFVDAKVISSPFIPHAKLLEYMQDARVIICHGGPATIYQALSFGKVPWVLPREYQYGEHLNNHQAEFADFLSRHGLVRIVTPKTLMHRILTSNRVIPPIQKNNPDIIAFLHTITQIHLPKPINSRYKYSYGKR